MTIQLAETIVWPPVLLAPMAGVTDLPFRTLVAKFGAGLVVSEMVASQEMVQAKPGVRERAELGFDASGTAVQLAGREAHWMSEAARMAEANGARVIDINMGCPAKKVVGGLSGSALMKTPDHALELIDAVVSSVSVPVTLKMRLGWDLECCNAPDMARRAEAAGIRMITVHGRTRCQFYKGQADWAAVGDTVLAVDVPVVVNGDITGSSEAATALHQSGAAGVMVGRGAQGRPWLLARIAADLFGSEAPEIPQGEALADLIVGHHQDMLSFYGIELGVRVARKHLGWYMQDAGCSPELRKRVLTEKDPIAIHRFLREAIVEEKVLAA